MTNGERRSMKAPGHTRPTSLLGAQASIKERFWSTVIRKHQGHFLDRCWTCRRFYFQSIANGGASRKPIAEPSSKSARHLQAFDSFIEGSKWMKRSSTSCTL